MSLIIYSKSDSKNLLGIKSINDSVFKKLMYNEIHKKGTKQKKVKTTKGVKVIDIERQDDKL